MRSKILFGILALVLIAPASVSASASEWLVIGAGNATCSHWNTGKPGQQTEILSWMTGFASAMNLQRASEKAPEYHLEYLTYDYLRHQIDIECPGADVQKSMISILFSVLAKLPVRSN